MLRCPLLRGVPQHRRPEPEPDRGEEPWHERRLVEVRTASAWPSRAAARARCASTARARSRARPRSPRPSASSSGVTPSWKNARGRKAPGVFVSGSAHLPQRHRNTTEDQNFKRGDEEDPPSVVADAGFHSRLHTNESPRLRFVCHDLLRGWGWRIRGRPRQREVHPALLGEGLHDHPKWKRHGPRCGKVHLRADEFPASTLRVLPNRPKNDS